MSPPETATSWAMTHRIDTQADEGARSVGVGEVLGQFVTSIATTPARPITRSSLVDTPIVSADMALQTSARPIVHVPGAENFTPFET